MPYFRLQIEHDLVLSIEVKLWNLNSNRCGHRRRIMYMYIKLSKF